MSWDERGFRLFISHISKDKALATEVANMARGVYGFDAFVAHQDIEPTAQWQKEIESALCTMDAMLAVMTPGFSGSCWCNQEVGWALGSGKLVIALMAGEAPHGFCGSAQGLSMGDGDPKTIMSSVFGILAENAKTANRMVVEQAKRLRSARSWESIKDSIAPHYRRCKPTPEALDIVEEAFKENDYVRSSHYLSDLRHQMQREGRIIPPKEV